MRNVTRIFSVLFVFSVLCTGCQPRNQMVPPPPPKVTVALPIQRPVQDYFYTTGQTQAMASVELRARVAGFLQQINFKDGDLVAKDQLLFVIDPAPYQAALDSASAALEKAKAQLVLAERQLARTNILARENAATESTLDIQNAERASAAADVAGAEAALRQAQLNLDYTEVKAPFAGRIGRHLVDLGNLVSASATLLATIETVSPIYANFTLSEQELLGFMEKTKSGELKPIEESGPVVIELALGNSDKFLYKGRLDFMEFGINPRTGTTDRRAIFDNEDVSLVPGMFCRLRAPVGPPRERLLVDDRAISTDQRGNYLLTVDSENTVVIRPVVLGSLQDGLRVIESGISPEDRIVINGLQRARPGSVVEPTKGSMIPDRSNRPATPAPAKGEPAQGEVETTAPASSSNAPAGAAPESRPSDKPQESAN